MDFLPVNQNDMHQRHLDELDIILVSGDAYVDHPAWAAALLGRFLEYHGYRVGIIAQPDWQNVDDFKQLGAPRLFFGISAGNLDSMVSHYTADKKKRREDLFSPGGKAGYRPDRATLVYANRLRQAYPGIPLVIGGVEASLRRFSHYDYWADRVRRSVLVDSRADLLVFGMGEYTLLEIARELDSGKKIDEITSLPGTGYAASQLPADAIELPPYESVKDNLHDFTESTRLIHSNINPHIAARLAQKHGSQWVIMNPPALPLSSGKMDRIYQIPFLRRYHPMYESAGGIPALKPVQFSIVTHRGCFGGCAFCSIGLHQGKFIQGRSMKSLLLEADSFTLHPDFKGSIPDVGAPSANMYGMAGHDEKKCRECRRESCLYPAICKNLNTDHSRSVQLWQKMRKINGLKNIRVASGVRYDLILKDPSGQYLHDLCQYHVGGQLKIAPEHIAPSVTRLMGKPGSTEYEKFMEAFKIVNNKLGKKQYLIPYFIAAHPGSSLEDSITLAEFLRDHLQYYPEQVQNFTPTPMTLSTSMYYTEINPINRQNIYVAKSSWERKAQRALLQYRSRENRQLLREILQKCGRSDLIGTSSRALLKEGASVGNKNSRRPEHKPRKKKRGKS